MCTECSNLHNGWYESPSCDSSSYCQMSSVSVIVLFYDHAIFAHATYLCCTQIDVQPDLLLAP